MYVYKVNCGLNHICYTQTTTLVIVVRTTYVVTHNNTRNYGLNHICYTQTTAFVIVARTTYVGTHNNTRNYGLNHICYTQTKTLVMYFYIFAKVCGVINLYFSQTFLLKL